MIQSIVHIMNALILKLKRKIEMITINDFDSPIMAAQKIIHGIRKEKICQAAAALTSLVPGTAILEGDPFEFETDMFNREEIKEIADYLMVYYNSHTNGD